MHPMNETPPEATQHRWWWISSALALLAIVAACTYFVRGAHHPVPSASGEASVSETSAARSKPRATATKTKTSRNTGESVVPFQTYAETLLARGANGDAAAATEVFQITSQCNHAQSVSTIGRVTLRVCAKESRPEFVERCRHETDGLEEKVQRADHQAAVCDGPGEAERVRLRYQAAVMAAKFGNTDAQACVVGGDFKQTQMLLPEEEKERYQIDAIGYFKSAMERGDWRVVQAMTIRRRGFGHVHGLQYLLTDGDDQTVYRMFRLLRMGAVGDYAATLDLQLRSFSWGGVDPEKFEEADAWAKQEYEQHFSKSAPLTERPVICGTAP